MRFLCYHKLPAGTTIEDVRHISELMDKESDVHGLRSYLNLSSGKAVCVIDAVSQQALEDFFRKNNLPYDEIVPIEVEGEHGVMTDLRTTETVVA